MTKRLTKHQAALLNVVMLGVLLAAAGSAWTLVYLRRTARVEAKKRGAEIIGKIKSKGLGNYWPGRNPRVLWYLVSSIDGRAVGWKRVSISPADGKYRGSDLFVHEGAGFSSEENWQISSSLSAGRYEGITQSPSGYRRTNITLNGGKLTVSQNDRIAQSPVPENYIPEGVFRVVLGEVSAGGRVADFKMVFNDEAFEGDEVNFRNVIISPQGNGKVVVNLPGKSVNTYWLDESGQISKIKMRTEGLILELVPRSTLENNFPGQFRGEPTILRLDQITN